MKNVKIRNRLIIAFSCLLFISTVLCILLLNNVKQTKADCVINGTIESEYFIGQELTVPNGTFDIDNTSVSADVEVVLPDGKTVATNKLDLDQTGLYTVRYVAKKGNNSYYDEKQFSVYNYLYEATGNGSVSYGAEEKLDGQKGLKLALTDDSVFKLNKKVNLNDLFFDNLPFIKFHITPETEGYAELDYIYVKVTDAYDPDKFFALEFQYWSSNLWGNKQLGVWGCINNFARRYHNDVPVALGLGTTTGWRPYASFVGNTEDNTLQEQYLSLYYNSLTQRVMGEDLTGVQSGVLGLASFPDIWQGFTNGDVYISVYGNSFRATKAHLFIDSIGNVDFTTNKIVDNTAPEITVNYDKFDNETYPNGYVNASYPVFDAIAFDANDGTVLVNKTVYYNYYSKNKVNVVVNNGKFVPTKKGVYTIVYTATDYFGNVANEYVDVEVLDASTAPEFNYEVSSEYVQTCIVGQSIVLPTVSFSGEVGYFNSTIKITKEGKSFEQDIQNGEFRVLESGSYSVSFVATDFLGRSSNFNYTLTATVSDKPIFADEPNKLIPSKFIVGYSHKLPEIKALFVNSDNTIVDVPVSITVNNGTITSGNYTPATAGEATITVSASYNGKTNQIALNRKVYSIVNEYGIDMKSLFVCDTNITSEYTTDGFAEYKVTGTGKIEFLNTVLSENAGIKIQTDKDFNDVNEININLYNPTNNNKKVQLKLKNFDGMAFASANGQEFQSVFQGDFSGNNGLDIKYVDTSKTFTVNGLSYPIIAQDAGIGNDFAILEVEIIGTSNTSVYGLIVERVGNQSIKNDTVIDISKPMIANMEDFGGIVKYNSTYKTPKIVAKDMISPDLKSFTMTITAPDGTYVNIDGVEMFNVPVEQITMQATQYGSYLFEYVAVDTANKKETFRFAINVLDDVEPIVSFDGDYVVEGKVGEEVKIVKFYASDNCDSEDKLTKTVLVLNPKGTLDVVSDKFTPNSAGRYTVYLYVTDTFGNVGLSYYIVEVK